MAASKFYITTPIYYVNDKPHIGTAYTTVLADVLARFHRLLGDPTFFLTGTDEHGQKVAKAAAAANMTPQQQADATVVRFQDAWKKLGITNDDFIRTTEKRHTKIVQQCLQKLWDAGEIYKSDYDGWYDVSSEQFVTEKDIPEGKKPEDMPNLTRITESNYFFKMSKYQGWLVDYINANPKFIQPDFRRNETLGFLRKPLQDLCISRPKSRLSWGIELPFDRDYVCYVWFDALVNYISAVGYLSDESMFKKWWPASVHLIGKDILTTHTVYWPTMLKALGVALPECVFAHGWWLMGDAKMSKSLGNVVNPLDLMEKYGADAFRYFLIAEMSLGQDASFSEEAFIRRFNADLANDLGNLLSRLLNMTKRFCDGKIPAPGPDPLAGPQEAELWENVQKTVALLEESIHEMRLDLGVGHVLTAVKGINRYFELKQPWTQGKQADKAPLHTTLYLAAESLRVCSQLLSPVMPEKMEELRAALGLRGPCAYIELKEFGKIPPGREVREIGALFPRVESKEEKMSEEKTPEINRLTIAPPGVYPEERISSRDFAKIQLRTAKILHAEKIEGADKLLKLQVMVGEERRQIVAGIALHYEPDALIGKSVVIVANLKPATIKGVESDGMVLVASKGEVMRLVTVDGELSSGAVVK